MKARTAIVSFEPALLPAVVRFAERTWNRPRTEEFYRWSKTHRTAAILSIDDAVLALYDGATGYDTLGLPSPEVIRWLTCGYAGSGSFHILSFVRDTALRGWTLGRLYPTAAGTETALVDVYAPRPDVPTYAWMVSETVRELARHRPRRIVALTTCRVLEQALRANRFVKRGTVPVHFWSQDREPPRLPMHLARNAADWSFLPYPPSNASRPNGPASRAHNPARSIEIEPGSS